MTKLIGHELGGAYCGVVHQNRLVLAGSAIVSDLILVSRVGDHTNFRLGARDETGRLTETDASDGFWFQQVSSRRNTFHAILQQNGLFFLGDLGEAIVPAGEFTAGNVQINENSWQGSDIGRSAIIVSGLVVFVQAGGRDIRGLQFHELEGKHAVPSLFQLSGPMVQRVRDMTFTVSEGRRGDCVYAIDDVDGSIAVMVRRPDGIAWSRWRTEGQVIAGTAPLGNLTFLVERDGVVGIEIPDPAAGTPGERHLDASTVTEWGATEPATPEGQVTVPHTRGEGDEAETRYETGYEFERVVETLPFVARSQSGTRRSVTRSRIIAVSLDCVPYRDIAPNETPGPENRVPTDVRIKVGRSDKRATPRKGKGDTPRLARLRFGGRSGWRYRSSLRFTFREPVQIAGLEYLATG